jgi:hypothetical protein
MKVVINACFGGFSLSARGLKRFAELKGRPCYFFKQDITGPLGFDGPMVPISVEEAGQEYMFHAYDIPNPDEVLPRNNNWHNLTMEERQVHNEIHRAHSLDVRPDCRHDPDLVRVVEELGGGHREGASGRCAELKVVEILDGVDYVIDEYDGNEHIAEAHRTWQ